MSTRVGLVCTALALVGLLVCSAPALAERQIFKPARDLVMHGDARDVAVADLNDDGLDDVAATSPTTGKVELFVAGPFGLPSAGVPFEAGTLPDEIAIADLNRDGIPDVVVDDPPDQSAEVLINNGDGGLNAPVRVGLPDSPTTVALADVDGRDGPDVIAPLFDGDKTTDDAVAVLLNDGNGSFSAPSTYAVGRDPISVAAADFDTDGATDLAVSNAALSDLQGDDSGSLSILLGEGDGTFSASDDVELGGDPRSVLTADFDGDAVPDLLTTDGGAGAVSLRGLGDGTFETRQLIHTDGEWPQDASLGRLDANLTPDVAISEEGSDPTELLLSKGDGTFEVRKTPSELMAWHRGVAVGQLDQSPGQDLVFADQDNKDLDLIRGDGQGGFDAPAVTPIADPREAIACDFNADHLSDLAAPGDTWKLNVVSGAPVPPFSDWQLYSTGPVGYPTSAVCGDFNNDGLSDVAVAQNSGDLVVLINDGTGSLVLQGTLAMHAPGYDLVTADFTGDGNLDLGVANYARGPGYTEQRVSICVGDGLGGFEEEPGRLLLDAKAALTVGNFNRDARPDLAAAYTSQGASVYLNRGLGRFRAPLRLDTRGGSDSVLAGDLDGRGYDDLILGGTDVRAVASKGAGMFSRPKRLGVASSDDVIALGQFTGREDPDLVVGDMAGITVLEGRRGVSFVARQSLTTDFFPRGLALADYNGDGIEDLAATDDYAGEASFFLGTGL